MLISKKGIGSKKLLKQDEDISNEFYPIKDPILTATNFILLLYDSSQNRDLKCNKNLVSSGQTLSSQDTY